MLMVDLPLALLSVMSGLYLHFSLLLFPSSVSLSVIPAVSHCLKMNLHFGGGLFSFLLLS